MMRVFLVICCFLCAAINAAFNSALDFDERKVLAKGSSGPDSISYFGGPVMDKGVNVYLVWYGEWSNVDKTIIKGFISSLGSKNKDADGSARRWWNINGLYKNASGKYLSTNISLSGEINDDYSLGKNLTTIASAGNSKDDAATIIFSAMMANKLPFDIYGIYLFLTSSDVLLDGFCSVMCGYHYFFTVGSNVYKYAFVGNPATQCTDCFSGHIASGGKGIVSTIAHELTETVTDPNLLGWRFNRDSQSENADQCVSQFGQSYIADDGTVYNLQGANNTKYLVQLNLNPSLGKCVLQQPQSCPKLPFSPIGITYQLGPVLDKGVNVYIIWYGAWSRSQMKIIRSFVQSLGEVNCTSRNTVCKWWRVTLLYYNSNGQFLSPQVHLKGEYSLPGASNLNISSEIPSLLKSLTVKQGMKRDINGVYLVLTGSKVAIVSGASRLCSCWERGFDNGYIWAWVGNMANICPALCGTGNSRNGDVGVDNMVSYLAVAMTQAAIDPAVRFGWYNFVHQYGRADCSDLFGKTFGSAGQLYNLVAEDGTKYLVQANWNPKTGECVLQP